MRYQGKTKSRKDQSVDVYSFAFGMQEIDSMVQVFKDFGKRCPDVIETQQIRQRIRSLVNEFRKFKQFAAFDKREMPVELS